MRFVWIVVLALICAVAARGQGAGVITGDYMEDRSNHVHGCYCEWSGESITGGREAVLAWRIRSGEYGGVDLSGAEIVAVVRGDSTLSIGAPPRQSVLLISSAAPAEKRRAAEALIRDRYGAFLGTVLAVRHVSMDFDLSGETARVRVPGLLALEMRQARLPDDALPGATKWFDPFVTLTSYQLGTTTQIRYSGREFGLAWSRTVPATTGYFGSFSLYPR